MMNYAGLLTQVPERFRDDFIEYVTSGDATPEFLAFLDEDEAAQQAVEEAFAGQVRMFERRARRMNVDLNVLSQYVSDHGPATDVVREASKSLASSLIQSAEVPSQNDDHLIESVVAAVADASESDAQRIVDVIAGLNERLQGFAIAKHD